MSCIPNPKLTVPFIMYRRRKADFRSWYLRLARNASATAYSSEHSVSSATRLLSLVTWATSSGVKVECACHAFETYMLLLNNS